MKFLMTLTTLMQTTENTNCKCWSGGLRRNENYKCNFSHGYMSLICSSKVLHVYVHTF